MLTKEVATTYRFFHGESDYQIMVDIINGSKDVDGLERTSLLEDTANQYKYLKNCDPYTDMVFAEVDGQTVGYGRCWWDEQIDGLLGGQTVIGLLLEIVAQVHSVDEGHDQAAVSC